MERFTTGERSGKRVTFCDEVQLCSGSRPMGSSETEEVSGQAVPVQGVEVVTDQGKPSKAAQPKDESVPYAILRSAKTVRDVMHEVDGAEPSGESDQFHCRPPGNSDLEKSDTLAFIQACLSNPVGATYSKVPVPKNYQEARGSVTPGCVLSYSNQ